MATNKHAIIRYQALDKCFRNPGRKYFIEDLVKAANEALREFTGVDSGVQKRQIYADVIFMESDQGWSVLLDKIKDGRKVYYRYNDISFSINNKVLNERDEMQLREAIITLTRFKGMPQFEWVDELVAKLEQGLRLGNRKDIIIEFEQNQFLKGLNYITPIYESIQNRKAINVNYLSFKREEAQKLSISPYYLKQYNNRWFLFGATKGYQNLTNLALDRIIGIEISKEDFIPNKSIDFNEYFDDIIGVTFNQNEELQRVKIKVDSNLIEYLKTKPIHGSQKYKGKESDDGVFELELIPNYEFESLLLSHGEKIKVIEPKKIKDKIRQRLNEALEKYKD